MKKGLLSLIALCSVVAIVGAACSNSGGSGGGTGATGGALKKGGTLHVALVSDVTCTMDPNCEYYSESFALLHDMTRTLLSYKPLLGIPGDVPVPDLASALPQVTDNAQTWTFKLKPGIKFGPPISRPITCADFQTNFQREFSPTVTGAYSFYYTVIQGADDFNKGKAKTISGVQCPDPSTVVFKLTQPTGDFNYRVSLPAAAPLPAEAIKGHDSNYGRYLVPSGCYMWQGQDQLNFKLPIKQQKPAIGYQPGKSMTLVRNPAWDASTDDLRACYADQIDLSIGGDPSDLYNKVQAGAIDWIDDVPSNATALRTFRADPNLKNQISPSFNEDSTFYISMNTTVPPFDDIHVRKAMNLIIDKAAMLRVRGGPDFGVPASHIVPPSMAGALPPSYDPYATPGSHGDLAKAEAEMKLSKYDTNHDGICDAPACKDIFSFSDSTSPIPDVTASIKADIAKIGITLKDRPLEIGTMYDFYGTTAKKIGLFPSAGWLKDYADQYTYIGALFDGRSIIPSGNVNYSMVNDPTVNSMIDKCQAEVGDPRNACWANMDKYVMENVVPWVPWRWGKNQYLYSNRIAKFTVTQFSAGSDLTQIALTPQAIAQG